MKANLDTIQASVGAVADGMGTLNEKSDRMAVDLTDIQITTAKTHAGVANLVSVHSSMSPGPALPLWTTKLIGDRR